MAIRGIRKNNPTSPVKLNAVSMIEKARSEGLYDNYKLDVTKLVEKYEIKVCYVDFPSDISGALRKENNKWIIYVNDKHSPNRQRYTIAHEFGHFCLHKDYTNEFEDKTFFRKEKDWTSIEYDANQFAADLLMPSENVENALDNNIITLKDLSETFGVSMIAMRNRLLSLNYKLIGDE